MADDHAFPERQEFDLDTDEGLEAFMADLESRRPIPANLRYPETDEDYDRLIAEAEAEADSKGCIPIEKVEAWVRAWGTPNELPGPEPECE